MNIDENEVDRPGITRIDKDWQGVQIPQGTIDPAFGQWLMIRVVNKALFQLGRCGTQNQHATHGAHGAHAFPRRTESQALLPGTSHPCCEVAEEVATIRWFRTERQASGDLLWRPPSPAWLVGIFEWTHRIEVARDLGFQLWGLRQGDLARSVFCWVWVHFVVCASTNLFGAGTPPTHTVNINHGSRRWSHRSRTLHGFMVPISLGPVFRFLLPPRTSAFRDSPRTWRLQRERRWRNTGAPTAPWPAAVPVAGDAYAPSCATIAGIPMPGCDRFWLFLP